MKKRIDKKILIILVGLILLAAGFSYAVYAAGVVFFGGEYRQNVVTFTTVGNSTWVVPEGVTFVDALVVAGGGGGGSSSYSNGGAGGGGAGGLKYISAFPVTAGQTINITVGAGGAPGAIGAAQNGSNGSNSLFGSIIATGGGYGAAPQGTGGSGGSGGGGGYNGYSSTRYGGSGLSGEGNNGGNTPLLSYAGAAGGGGAGGVGGDNKTGHVGGDRGPGMAFSITGNYIVYATGGSGGSNSPAETIANTGNGGDGAYGNEAYGYIGTVHAGGSGIVIIRYGKSKMAASSIESGLVGHWALDGDGYNASTGRVTDKTPYENHGTNYGATLTTDRNGQTNGAMSFDGSNQIALSSPNTVRANGQPMTVSAWVYWNGGSGYQDIVAQRETYNWMLYLHGNNHELSFHGDGQYRSSYVMPQNQWKHIVATVTSGGVSTIYVDGAVVYTNPSYSYHASATSNLWIGSMGGSEYFKGSISDVRIYNRALSATEVTTLYGAYKPKVTAGSLQQGLILDMPLTSNYTKTVTAGSQIMTDKTPYSNDGQNYGATVGSDSTSFNGSGNKINLSNVSQITNGNYLTTSLWFNTSDGSKYQDILDLDDSTGGVWVVTNGGLIEASFQTVSNPLTYPYSPNQWYHVVQVGNNNVHQLYINGVLVATGAQDVKSNISLANGRIGNVDGDRASEYFNGSISAVKIYNRALSPQEIESLYVQGATNLGGVKTHRASCKEILNAGESTGDGFYTIKPNSGGLSFRAYCDMTTDGGGWTLVLLNNKGLTSPTPTWDSAINDVNTTGSLNSNLTSFDLFLGVSYWKNLGTKMRLQIGSSPSSLSNKAVYSGFSFAGNYALTMSGETIVVGSGSSGMYTYHAANHFNLSTSDRDNDVYAPGHCSAFYGGTPWWYGECWSGSFWGFSTAEGPRWTGADGGTDQQWGSIWIGQ